ncbi:hypothetical protein [Limnohabitans sp. TS-CS-82]|uniref:hypothetical protein n=1 Tax=Limnohabitans sp. TS-CS-82 TaxID=2094193 RepID=UPI0013752C34|nr:hypothetical protein [Limnohabitans sp. TS-CS-82]
MNVSLCILTRLFFTGGVLHAPFTAWCGQGHMLTMARNFILIGKKKWRAALGNSIGRNEIANVFDDFSH